MSKGVSCGAVMSKYWFAGTCPEVYIVVSNSQECCWFNPCPLRLISAEIIPRSLYSPYIISHHVNRSFILSKRVPWKSFGMSWHFRFSRLTWSSPRLISSLTYSILQCRATFRPSHGRRPEAKTPNFAMRYLALRYSDYFTLALRVSASNLIQLRTFTYASSSPHKWNTELSWSKF